MTWIQITEIIYWFAGIVIAFVALLGLERLNILKADIRIRNTRAASEQAINCVMEWADVQQDIRPFINSCESAEIDSYYDGSIDDFMFNSLAPDAKKIAEEKEKIIGWAKPINHLEAVAASFIKGVADEITGFEIMGRDYCLIVGALYDIIAVNRKHEVMPLYSNIVELYKIWAARLSTEEIKSEKNRLEELLHTQPQQKLKPIGTEDF